MHPKKCRMDLPKRKRFIDCIQKCETGLLLLYLSNFFEVIPSTFNIMTRNKNDPVKLKYFIFPLPQYLING